MKTAIDTNVLVRFLTCDDADQAREAASAIQTADIVVIPALVLCEAAWVLRRAYGYTSAEIADALHWVIEAEGVETEDGAAAAGLHMLEAGGDFADGVILYQAERANCDRLATFDRRFAETDWSDRIQLLGG